MSLGRRRRFAILERDDFTCRYCGRRAPDVALEVDHIQPKAHGGSDHPDNLVTACEDCNRGKSAAWDTSFYVSIADRLDALESDYHGAVERIAQLEEWVANRTSPWFVMNMDKGDTK